MRVPRTRFGSRRRRARFPIFGPDIHIQLRPWISDHPIGLILAIGLGLMLIIGVPISILLLIPALLVGGLFAAFLHWRRT